MSLTYIQFCGDVSGSMSGPYNQNYKINQNLPRSESLFEILEKTVKILSKKNQNVFFSSMLFGCKKSPTTDFLLLIDFVIDNISLLRQISEENNKDYRKLLTRLLQREGAESIRNYMYRSESHV